MKKILFVLLLFITMAFSYSSCSKETDLDEQKHRVEVRVKGDKEGVKIRMDSYFGTPMYFTESFEGEFITDAYCLSFDVFCDEPYVLLTLEIYVDGKLKVKRYGNRMVKSVIRIKGKGLD